MDAVVEESDSGLRLPAWAFIVGVLVGGTALHVWLHHRAHGVVNAHHAALAFFLVMNVLVNFWEIALCFCLDRVQREYEATREAYRGRELTRVNEIFLQRIPVTRLLSLRRWTGIWSGYALFDPGYAQRASFGYNIDVGNGLSTLVPATLFAFGMTYEIVPARVLGIVGIAMFWQMLYGTLVYLFQYFNNRRHHGFSARMVFAFVGMSNGLWLLFPAWGIAVSVWMIYADGFGVFTGAGLPW